MKQTAIAIFIGGAGGAGFSWLLQHVPFALAAVLAVGSFIALARMVWVLYRGIRQFDKEFAEHMEWLGQIRKTGSN